MARLALEIFGRFLSIETGRTEDDAEEEEEETVIKLPLLGFSLPDATEASDDDEMRVE